jgi:hypothetical protein
MKIYVNDIDAAWSYIHDVILDCFSDDLDEDMLKVMDDDDKAQENRKKRKLEKENN